MKVLIFLPSTMPEMPQGPFTGRLATRVAAFVRIALESEGCEVELADPDDLKLPLLEMPFHWLKILKKPIPENIQRLNDLAAWADAYVALTGEYNYSPSPVLMNMLNHIAPAAYGGKMARKPSMIVSYSLSKFGGARGAFQLRAMLGELGTLGISPVCNFGEVNKELTPEGVEVDTKTKPLSTPLKKAIDELLFVAQALNDAKQKTGNNNNKKAAKNPAKL